MFSSKFQFSKLGLKQDVILAAFIIGIIFMLIIPLPTAVLDGIIALNIGISVILLMVAIYLKSPLEFAAFPAVLLITTLLRLAISISTTRLILLNGDAGHIVETFGNFVVGGNLIVGLIVFLILTIVNFIVITKGAERVAEVGARFSLDAMPGKQLSIDADVRAGSLSVEQAKIARSKLTQESKLYGSMDGAMKFVKGDAIATLIIVFVNMIGGLGIGVGQRGLEFSEALHLYTILTIGDGLIAQIPALLIAITAGIIVTRVTDDAGDGNLAKDISRQVSGEPKVLYIGAAVLLLFGVIPGFPTLIFLFLSASLIGVGLYGSKMRKKVSVEDREEAMDEVGITSPMDDTNNSIADLGQITANQVEIFAPTNPILIEFGADGKNLGVAWRIKDAINNTRLRIYYRLGINIPVIDIKLNPSLQNGKYRIYVNEIPASDGVYQLDKYLCFDNVENLELYQIPFSRGEKFIPTIDTIWVDIQYQSVMDSHNIKYKTPLDHICFHTEFVVAKNAGLFIGIQEVKRIMNKMEQNYPDLIKEAARVLPVQTITELMRRLVQEFVSLRDLRQIFGTMVEWGGKEKDPILLVEHIRTSLARQISYQHCIGNNILQAILLDNKIEEQIRQAVRQTSGGSYLALDPKVSKNIIAKIKAEMTRIVTHNQNLVLVTTMDIRRYVRRMIETDIPQLSVLSYQEISTEITLQPMGRIIWEG